LINAVDAMPEGGVLNISAKNALDIEPMIDRRHSMPSLLSNNFIEIIVRDNGVGMPQNIVEKVFNPFFTTKSNGTGLGLSIVYQIIKEHGGQIEVDSPEEGGTSFRILLPALEKYQTETV
jgi:signal transduction histidine kinase